MIASWVHWAFIATNLYNVIVICVSIVLCLMAIVELIMLARAVAGSSTNTFRYPNERSSCMPWSTSMSHLCSLSWLKISLCCIACSKRVLNSLLRWAYLITLLTISVSHIALESCLSLLLAWWLIGLIILDILGNICTSCVQSYLPCSVIKIIGVLSVEIINSWIRVTSCSWATFAPLMICLVCVYQFWTSKALFLLVEEIKRLLIDSFFLSRGHLSVIILSIADPRASFRWWLWLLCTVTMNLKTVPTGLV